MRRFSKAEAKALNSLSDMTQVVLYMSQNMLIPSEPERVAAKSSEGENQLAEQKPVIEGFHLKLLRAFCSDRNEIGVCEP